MGSKLLLYALMFGVVAAFSSALAQPQPSTFLPHDLQPITVDNAADLVEVAAIQVPERVYDFAFNPDGTMLATHSGSRVLRIWSMFTGEELVQLTEPDDFPYGGIFDLTFTPDGTRLAMIYDGALLMWDIPAFTPTVCGACGIGASSFAFSPDSSTVLISPLNVGESRLVDIESGEGREFFVLGGYYDFHPNGNIVALTSGNTTFIQDIAADQTLYRLYAPRIHFLFFTELSRDGSTLAQADYHGYLALWDVQTGALSFGENVTEENEYIADLDFNYDGSLLAIATYDGISDNESRVWLWDTNIDSELSLLEIVEGDVIAPHAGFNPDGSLLAISFGDGSIRFYGVPSSPALG